MSSPCICIFSALYPPSMGGVEAYTENLAQTLAEAGYRIIVVTLATHGSRGTAVENGIEVVRLPCRGCLNNRYPVAQKNSRYRALWSHLQNERIDYVIVNTRFYLHSLEGLAFARAKGIAPILIEHGSAHLTTGSPLVDAGVKLVEHAVTRAGRRYAASYYAVSRKSSAWLSHFGIASQGELPNASRPMATYPMRANAISEASSVCRTIPSLWLSLVDSLEKRGFSSSHKPLQSGRPRKVLPCSWLATDRSSKHCGRKQAASCTSLASFPAKTSPHCLCRSMPCVSPRGPKGSLRRYLKQLPAAPRSSSPTLAAWTSSSPMRILGPSFSTRRPKPYVERLSEPSKTVSNCDRRGRTLGGAFVPNAPGRKLPSTLLKHADAPRSAEACSQGYAAVIRYKRISSLLSTISNPGVSSSTESMPFQFFPFSYVNKRGLSCSDFP